MAHVEKLVRRKVGYAEHKAVAEGGVCPFHFVTCRWNCDDSTVGNGSSRVSPLFELIARKRSLEFSNREAASRQ